jgi:hypothetical protein
MRGLLEGYRMRLWGTRYISLSTSRDTAPRALVMVGRSMPMYGRQSKADLKWLKRSIVERTRANASLAHSIRDVEASFAAA